MSAGSVWRPRGAAATAASQSAGAMSGGRAAGPGAMAFTCTPLGASSRARARAVHAIAAFAAMYGRYPRYGAWSAAQSLNKTTCPRAGPGLAAIRRAAASAKSAAARASAIARSQASAVSASIGAGS